MANGEWRAELVCVLDKTHQLKSVQSSWGNGHSTLLPDYFNETSAQLELGPFKKIRNVIITINFFFQIYTLEWMLARRGSQKERRWKNTHVNEWCNGTSVTWRAQPRPLRLNQLAFEMSAHRYACWVCLCRVHSAHNAGRRLTFKKEKKMLKIKMSKLGCRSRYNAPSPVTRPAID